MKSLKFALLLTPLFLIWYLFLTWKFQPDYSITPFPTQAPVNLDASKLSSLINEHRQKLGLSPFIEDERLCVIARERVEEQYKLGKLDYHAGFFARYHSYPYYISENVNEGYTNEKDSLRGWLNSPPHKKALEGNWTYACVATKGSFAEQIFSNFSSE